MSWNSPVVTWTPHPSKIPWRTYLRGKTRTTGVRFRRCLLPIGLKICWITVSKAVEWSSKISIEDLDAALASPWASTTESKAVLVVCTLLKPDWLLSRRFLYLRKAETWLTTTRSTVFAMKGKRENYSSQNSWVKSALFCIIHHRILNENENVNILSVSVNSFKNI